MQTTGLQAVDPGCDKQPQESLTILKKKKKTNLKKKTIKTKNQTIPQNLQNMHASKKTMKRELHLCYGDTSAGFSWIKSG